MKVSQCAMHIVSILYTDVENTHKHKKVYTLLYIHVYSGVR